MIKPFERLLLYFVLFFHYYMNRM